ncbi:MAG: UDP-glucose--hexose-1-phosphate uridylyltransferase [Candidatus Marinimicrobia bacterium]|nr:UDP-glucose--hexose-1-phosphate uridylyltransferase [Candidatus Neomarinimicrobiota bacterium]
MIQFSFSDHPHRRYNPLSGEWVLVSPHRTKRPWRGKQETTPSQNRPSYDPKCYLCPGNARANGKINPKYSSTYVFTNDFAALLSNTPTVKNSINPLMQSESLQGTCRVICFSPRHDLTLAEMSIEEVQCVIDVWADQVTELGKRYRWIQIFENKGEIMGCSNPHPHGQVWAETVLPSEPFKEDRQQVLYFKENDSIMLLDYINIESEQKDRIVVENEHWIAIVPFWAFWPFETMLLPRRHVLRLPELAIAEKVSLSKILKNLLIKYDNLFNVSFPYTMGWHGAPTDPGNYTHWQLHAHFYPPLLRSSTVKKFVVGYEMLSEAQRDLTQEQAAGRLRNLSDIHYKLRDSQVKE